MSRKKQQQHIEEVPVDKLDHFLANNYKKLLSGIAILLVVFIAGYAFKNMNKAKNDLLMNKAGQLEMLFSMSGGSADSLKSYLDMSNEYPKAGDYINLKAAEVLVSNGDVKGAEKPLATAGGAFAELADGLRFDTGTGSVDTSKYMTSGKMSALWLYRAYLTADAAKKAEILESFKKSYPNNELLKQIERWNG